MTRLPLIDPYAPGEAPSVFGLRETRALLRSPQCAIEVFNDAHAF